MGRIKVTSDTWDKIIIEIASVAFFVGGIFALLQNSLIGLIFLWFSIYALIYATSTKIILEDSKLILEKWRYDFTHLDISTFWRMVISLLMPPKASVVNIELKEIKLAAFGELDYIERVSKENGDLKFAEDFRAILTWAMKPFGFRPGMWNDFEKSTFFYVLDDKGKYHLVDANYFQKKQVSNLIKALQERGVYVIFDR